MINIQGSSRDKRNKWKVLFFSLLVFNIICLAIVSYNLYPLFKPVAEQELAKSQIPSETKEEAFYIYATKESITETVNSYLETREDSVTISLDDSINLFIELPLFGMDVSLHAQFDPFVEPNGNLLLKQRAISFGMLQIPNEYALQYIANTIDLPDWVFVRPDEELIYIDLNHAQFGTNFQVSFEQFDLTQKDIILQLHVN